MKASGVKRPHGKVVGYVIQMGGYHYVGTVCNGMTDPFAPIVLGGKPATLFKTRRAAQRVIDSCAAQGEQEAERYQIIPLAPLKP